jgi:hypothetical protein
MAKDLTVKIKADNSQFKQKIEETSTSTSKLQSTFSNLSKVLAGVGGITVAFAAVKTSILSVQSTSDAFDMQMSAIRESTGQLSRSLATLDFTNFIENMREAAKVGIEYARILDDLFDRKNALSIRESELSIESVRLLKIGRDVTKSDQERIDAIKQMIALEESLMREKEQNANINFDAELKRAMQRSKLTADEIKDYLRLYDQKADIIKQVKEYEQALVSSARTDTQLWRIQEHYEGGIEALKSARKASQELVASTDESVIAFARVEKGMNNLDDAMRSSLVKAWTDVNKTILDFETSTQRAETTLNGLLKSLEKTPDVVRKLQDLPNLLEPISLKLDVKSTIVSVEEMREALKQPLSDMKAQFIDLSNFMSDIFTESFDMLGTALGAIFSGKDFGMDNFLIMMADWAKKLGGILIAAGLAIFGFKVQALANPLALVALGGALVAAGAAVKAAVSTNPATGINTSYGGAQSGGSIEGIRDWSGLKVSVTGELIGEGSSLKAVLDNESIRQNL